MMTFQARQAILEEILEEHPDLEQVQGSALKSLLAKKVGEHFQGSGKSLEEMLHLTQSLQNTMRGLDILQPYLDDPEVSEIMVNGPDQIFIEKQGRIRKEDLQFDSEDHLLRVINRCFGRANRLINEQRPIASLRFEDGSRLQAILPPASPDGPALSLRRFSSLKPDLNDLVKRDSLSEEAADFLRSAVRDRKNIFISGGTGSGKTTFLNALSAAIPKTERVITIEDTAELDLQGVDNLLRLEAREPGPDGEGEVSLEMLIRAALRLRPDRIIVGEVRGSEAYPMIEAMRTGHPGSMSTGHADNPLAMAERLGMLLMRSLQLPWSQIMQILCHTLDLIVQLCRQADGKRQVSLIGYPIYQDGSGFQVKALFKREGSGLLLPCKA